MSIISKNLSKTLLTTTIAACATTLATVAEEKTPTAIDMKRPYASEAFHHYNRAVELHQAGFIDQAELEYLAAVESDDRMEEAWSNLGGIYASKKEYSKALKVLDKALKIRYDRPTTLNAYGTALLGLDRIEEAIEKFNAALRIAPSSMYIRVNLDCAMKKRNQFKGYRTTHSPR